MSVWKKRKSAISFTLTFLLVLLAFYLALAINAFNALYLKRHVNLIFLGYFFYGIMFSLFSSSVLTAR